MESQIIHLIEDLRLKKPSTVDKLINYLRGDESKIYIQILKKHISQLKDIQKALSGTDRKYLSDIISFLISSEPEMADYRSEGNLIEYGFFGSKYTKDLLICIVDYHNKYKSDKFNNLAREAIKFLFSTNEVVDGIDFLYEFNMMESIMEYLNEFNYKRILNYLEQIDMHFDCKSVLYEIYKKYNIFKQCAFLLNLNNKNLHKKWAVDELKKIFMQNEKQFALIFNRCNFNADFITGDNFNIMKKIHMHALNDFKVNRDFDYKDEAMLGIIADAFKNYAMHNYEIKNLENNLISCIKLLACGLINLYSTTINDMSEYIFNEDSYIRTGGILGAAYAADMPDKNHTLLALTSDNLQKSTDEFLKGMNILALEHLYCGSEEPLLKELLLSVSMETDSMHIMALCNFTLGSIFYGSSNDELLNLILMNIRENVEYKNEISFDFLILGFCFLINSFEKNNEIYSFDDIKLKNEHKILISVFNNRGTDPIEFLKNIFKKTELEDFEESENIEFTVEHSISLFASALLAADKQSLYSIARICTSIYNLDNDILMIGSVVTLAYIYASNPKIGIIDHLIKVANQGNMNVSSAALFSLAIIGTGTKNKYIQDFFNEQLELRSDNKKVINIIEGAIGLLNLGGGIFSISKTLYEGRVYNKRGDIGLISILYIFMKHTDRVLNRFEEYILLLKKSFASKICSVITADNEISEREEIQIGKSVDISTSVGEPVDIRDTQVHNVPVVIHRDKIGRITEYSDYIIEGVIFSKILKK